MIIQLFNNLKITVFVFTLGSMILVSCKKEGCTNTLADNFDEKANVDNGLCIISGCMDTLSANFNRFANKDDGSCINAGSDFKGSYTANSSCITFESFTINIGTSNVENRVTISNLGNLGGSAIGTTNGNQITIESQNYVDFEGDSWTVSSEAGTYSDSKINIRITYKYFSSTLNCDEVWIK